MFGLHSDTGSSSPPHKKRNPFDILAWIFLLFVALCFLIDWAGSPWTRLVQCMKNPEDPFGPIMAAVFLMTASGFFIGFLRIRKHPSLGVLEMLLRLIGWSVLFGGLLTGFFRFLFTPDQKFAALVQSLLLSSGFSFYPALSVSILFTLGQRITGNLHK